MKNLSATKIMNTALVTVEPGESLGAALKLMEQQNVHHLLVVERGRMVGMLSSADLLKLALLKRPGEGTSAAGDAMGIQVRDVMQPRVAVMRENSSLRDVARALSLGGFHALPILAVDDTPVGIVTSSDLVGILIDQIECDTAGAADRIPPEEPRSAVTPHLLEVLRAAEVFLHSGQSGQQHARLIRAVERAREFTVA
jgi:acetoin utilization protein AcuB